MRWLPATLIALAVLVPGGAQATVRLGVGADLTFGGPTGVFELTLAVDQRIAKNIAVGGRFGAAVTSTGSVGAPIDVSLRAILSNRVYIEGFFGPWLFFNRGDILALHAAFGFGLLTKSFEVGLEVGWLDPSAMIGLRLAWRI